MLMKIYVKIPIKGKGAPKLVLEVGEVKEELRLSKKAVDSMLSMNPSMSVQTLKDEESGKSTVYNIFDVDTLDASVTLKKAV
jgi:hypothetical protein